MTGALTRIAGATARSASFNLASLSRAYNALPRFQRAYIASKTVRLNNTKNSARAYATAAASTTTKKTTKKTTATKKTASKKTPVKKKKAVAKPKKKKVVKKPVVKKKKVASPAQLAKATRTKALREIEELRAKSLTVPPKKPATAATLFAASQKGKTITGSNAIIQLSNAFKELSVIEKEHLERDAAHNKKENEMTYHNWILQHTPQQIKDANSARSSLRRKIPQLYPKRKASARSPLYMSLKDERQVKRALTAYNIYFSERIGSGAFAGQKLGDCAKLVGAEYKDLSGSDLKKYTDLADADKARYIREYTDTFGRPPPEPKAPVIGSDS